MSDSTYWIYSFIMLSLALSILLTFLLIRSCYKCIEEERSSVRNRFRGSQSQEPGPYYPQQNEPPYQYDQGARQGGYDVNNVNPLERPYMDNRYIGSKGSTNKIWGKKNFILTKIDKKILFSLLKMFFL